VATITVYPGVKPDGTRPSVVAQDLVTPIPNDGASVVYSDYYERLLGQQLLLDYDPVLGGGTPIVINPGSAVGDATVYVSPAGPYGIVGDGTTDDRGALDTLVNTTISAGGGTCTLQAPKTYRIGSNCSIPAHVATRVLRGGIIKPDAGVTVTILGDLEAGAYQVFDCTASGSLIKLPGKTVHPEWFGAKSDSGVTSAAVNAAAVFAACASLQGGSGCVEFLGTSGYYAMDPITLTASADITIGELTVKGQGWGTRLKHTVDYPFGFYTGAMFHITGHLNNYVEHLLFKDIWLSGNSTADHLQLVRLGFVRNAHFIRVKITDNGYEGIASVSTDACDIYVAEDCYAENIGHQPQRVAAYNSNANRTFIRGCFAKNCGMAIEHTGRGAIISDNQFEDCIKRAIMASSTTYHNEEVVITGNRIKGGDQGIIVADDDDSIGKTIVSDNIITFCDLPINVSAAADNGCEVFNNYIQGGDPNSNAIILGPGRHTVRGNTLVYTSKTTTGSISSTVLPNQLTCPRQTGLTDGMYVTIAGVTGTFRIISTQWSLSPSQIICTLDGNADATVVGAVVTYNSGKWASYIKATTDDYHVIEGNTFRGHGWTGAAVEVQGVKASVGPNEYEFAGAVANAFYISIAGTLTGLSDSHTTTPSTLVYSNTKRSEVSGSSTPGALTWKKGDILWRTNVAAGGSPMDSCVTDGSAGTLNSGATTGSITNGTALLTVNSTAMLYPGAWITIAGVAGAKRITAINGLVCTLHANANATVAGAAVAYSPPTWKAWPAVAA
jgi:hypothetical protein